MDAPAFLEDIYPQGLLHATVVRSPVACGFLRYIVYPKMPDSFLIITAKDIPGRNRLEETSAPILADDRLSYAGEPVAVLLGPDKARLEEFAAACRVVAQGEKAAFSCADVPADSRGAPAAARVIQTGKAGEEFVRSAKAVSGSYSTGIQDHWYAEPVGAVAWYEKGDSRAKKGGSAAVRTATQWPGHVRRSVAAALGLGQDAVAVEPTALSLHMDGKLWFPSLAACHAALGAYITGRPVRLILNREECFLYSPKRCAAAIDISSAIGGDGGIAATQIDIALNAGAYGIAAAEMLDQACLGALGFYGFGRLSLTARAEATNIPPQGPFSGFGLAQGFFAAESHVSHIADSSGQDPAEWRKAHADSRLMLPPGAQGKGGADAALLIDAASAMSDYRRKWSSYELLRQSRRGKPLLAEKEENPRGVGIALAYQGNGLLYSGRDRGAYAVEVTLTKESILEIKASITSADGDFERIWAKAAGEIMSIDPSMVRVNTAGAPDCGPSCASRNITAVTRLVEKCCLAIRKQRFHDPLPITVRRSAKPQGGSLYGGVFAAPDGKTLDAGSFSRPGMAAAVVEVSVDLIECIPKIRSVWLCVGGGKIVSENRARRSLARSAVQALGWAYSESIGYVDGVLPLEQYNNYVIPPLASIPPVNISFLAGAGDGAETRGIGELPFNCIPAAFAQAVSQAMDCFCSSIPVTRKDIWDIVRRRNAEAQAQGQK